MEYLKTYFYFCVTGMLFITSSVHALPFSITVNGNLPSLLIPGSTSPVSASYTIKNISKINPPYNIVKNLPANVSINPSGTTCLPTSHFTLPPGQSCTLNLTISGAVYRNDSNPQNHLMVCMSDKVTCAGPNPENSLNVIPVASWVNNLSSQGYHIVQGNVFLLGNDQCPAFVEVFNSCFGQNPASPYIVPQPPIENSYVDPYYAPTFTTPGPQGPTNVFYKLSNNDALITIVSYPPVAAYFGYQSYVFTSETSNYTNITPPLLRVVSPDPNRYDIFGSIGNDINNVIVQNQAGTVWGGSQVIMYITTSNQNLAEAIIAASHLTTQAIFVEPMGSNVITGNGSEADDLMTLMRYAVPQSSSDLSNWFNDINSNVVVYKLSNSKIKVSTYGTNAYTTHTTNNSELSLSTARLQLAELLQTYLTTAQSAASDIVPTIRLSVDNTDGVPSSGLVGSYCILYGTYCLGDNQDTSTYAASILNHLSATETAFIVGVNHSVSNLNNNRYVSVDIYNGADLTGVASSSQTNPAAVGFDSGVLTGSAQAILSALNIAVPPDTPLSAEIANLYVTFIARDCTNSTVAAIPEQYCINFTSSQVPLDGMIGIAERSYIMPGTTTGGNNNEMLYPLIIAAHTDF